jgi:glycosyltransferase involved in cell wall biosynthesis
MRRLRLLWVVPHLPRLGVAANRERWWNLLARLALRHDVTLLAIVDPDDVGAEHELPRGLAEVHTVPRTAWEPHDPWGLLPRMVRWGGFTDPALRTAVAERLAAARFDVVQYEYAEMAALMPPVTGPTLITVHQLGFAFAGPEWRAAGGGVRGGAVALFRHLRDLDFELRAVTRAHRVITMSPEDGARLQRFLPGLRVTASPVGVDAQRYRPPATPVPRECDLLFVGHFEHLANADAAAFLVHEVVPRLGRPVRVRLVGRGVTPAVAALAKPGAVEVVGAVPDVRPHLAAAGVVVAPVRFGTGMRGKVLEALGMGRPLVTTTLGAEGLGAVPERDLLVADGASAFAAAVNRVLDNADFAARLGAGGRALVESRFDWDAIAAAHEEIYDQVLRDPPPAAEPAAPRPAAVAQFAAGLGRWPALAVGAALVTSRGLRRYLRRVVPAAPPTPPSLVADTAASS